MKVTRNIKSAINRRANEIALQLTPKLAARLTALLEADELLPQYVEHWWPTSFDPILCNWGVSGGRHEAPADVCGYCDTEMPYGCGGACRAHPSCQLRKRGVLQQAESNFIAIDPAAPGSERTVSWRAPTAPSAADPLDAF